jgi:hypothetical protein
MPREARGQYDLIKCVAWYIRFLKRAIEKKTLPTLDGGDEGKHVARVRILRIQTDRIEMELSKLRCQLVAISDVEAVVADLARTSQDASSRSLRCSPRNLWGSPHAS